MNEASSLSLGILGAGAWGTALAECFASAGHKIRLYAREPELVEGINTTHINAGYLPNIKLNPAIEARHELTGLAEHDFIFLVVPAQYLRASCKTLKAALTKKIPIILCAKGIEIETGRLMHEVAKEELGDTPLAILSGPTFASEVANGLPAAVTIASVDESLTNILCTQLCTKSLRPYSSRDMVGVEVGGAIKNVLAIACGVVVGKGLGENARAALITRGLSEMTRLTVALGGKAETITGLSGLGDLVLTCSSPQSRNMSLGLALGQGRKLADVLGERHSVAEGISTARAVIALAAKHKVEMPLCAAVYNVLHENADVASMIDALLSRPLKAEG